MSNETIVKPADPVNPLPGIMVETAQAKPPSGHLLVVWGNAYGFTIGYFTGEDFILPFVKQCNWANFWMLHDGQRPGY
jgi:hypothetical protein